MLKIDELSKEESCWNKALLDEFMFILLARDATAPNVVNYWINQRISMGLNKPDDAQVIEAREWVASVQSRHKRIQESVKEAWNNANANGYCFDNMTCEQIAADMMDCDEEIQNEYGSVVRLAVKELMLIQATADSEKSKAHVSEKAAWLLNRYPDGLVPWLPERAPNLQEGITVGRLRRCFYCGSMHPADLATALRAGAKLSWADWKYRWPHKVYVNDIPNPHEGMIESRMGLSHPTQEQIDSGEYIEIPTKRYSEITGEPTFKWTHKGEPARATTNAKFYTVHLVDASEEDREVIQKAMGLVFEFSPDGKQIAWRAYESGLQFLPPTEKHMFKD